MKLNTARNSLDSNAVVESKDFGIGDASVVIEILRNRLYAHPIRTLVQEYICNGRDAIRETGKPNKLVVQAPTRFQPTFKVRDYGVGITPDRMNDIFIMYGASTKRNTNGQTGGFGIGAKSGFAYTDSFTIITYVDGTERHYVAHVGSNSNGRLDLIQTKDTAEANGTEIQIAVKPNDADAFREAILRCVYFWNDNEYPEIVGLGEFIQRDETPLVISKEIEAFRNMPRFLNPDDDSGLHLVIDGVVYNLDSGFVDKNKDLKKFKNAFSYGIDIAVKIPNGIVEVSASREKIADSERTRKVLNALAEQWLKQVVDYYNSNFKACKSVLDYVHVYKKLEGVINKENLQNQFGKYFITYDLTHAWFSKVNFVKVSQAFGRRRRRSHNLNALLDKLDTGLDKLNVGSIALELIDKIYFVDVKESKILLNKRIRSILKTTSPILLIEEKQATVMPTREEYEKTNKYTKLSDQEWNVKLQNHVDTQPLDAKDLAKLCEELQAKNISETEIPVETKEEKEKRVKVKSVISVHLARTNRKIEDVDLNTNTYKYVYAGLDYDRFKLAELRNFVETETDGILCRLSESAIDKVKNDPNFSKLEDFLAKVKVTNKLRHSRMASVAKNCEIVNELAPLKTAIKADDITNVIKAYESFQPTGKIDVPSALVDLVDADKEVKDFIALDNNFKDLLDKKYPLFKRIDTGYIKYEKEIAKEIAFYINAKN